MNDLTLQLNGISVQLRGLQADTNHLADSNQGLVHQALLLQVCGPASPPSPSVPGTARDKAFADS